MAIFNSYVKLPEGNHHDTWLFSKNLQASPHLLASLAAARWVTPSCASWAGDPSRNTRRNIGQYGKNMEKRLERNRRTWKMFSGSFNMFLNGTKWDNLPASHVWPEGGIRENVPMMAAAVRSLTVFAGMGGILLRLERLRHLSVASRMQSLKVPISSRPTKCPGCCNVRPPFDS